MDYLNGYIGYANSQKTYQPPWRNRLARSAVNRKVGGSSPPGGAYFYLPHPISLKRGLDTYATGLLMWLTLRLALLCSVTTGQFVYGRCHEWLVGLGV